MLDLEEKKIEEREKKTEGRRKKRNEVTNKKREEVKEMKKKMREEVKEKKREESERREKKILVLKQGPEPSWELGASPRDLTLGGKQVVKVMEVKGAHYVDIREYYARPRTPWEFKPMQGVSLTRDQFERLRDFLPQISSASLSCLDPLS